MSAIQARSNEDWHHDQQRKQQGWQNFALPDGCGRGPRCQDSCDDTGQGDNQRICNDQFSIRADLCFEKADFLVGAFRPTPKLTIDMHHH